MKGNKKMQLKKNMKIIGICAAIVLIVILIINLIIKIPAYKNQKKSEKAFVIPYINKGFIPQGITYDENSDNFYVTGYMFGSKASPIFIVNRQTGNLVNAIRMAKPNGDKFRGHAGGISITNEKIYIAGGFDGCFYVFDKSKVDNAEFESSVSYSEILNVKTDSDIVKASYTTMHNGMLYGGEFYRFPFYSTKKSHKEKTSDGTQHALIVGFNLENNNATAAVAYSIPKHVQGVCFSDEAIYFTTSWGLGISKLYKFNLNKLTQQGTKQVCAQTVPLYILTPSTADEIIKLPPMLEEIEFVNGKIYTLNEYASNKYLIGKLTNAKWSRAYKAE